MPVKKSFADLSADAKLHIREISAEVVAEKISKNTEDWFLIDVRENDEYREGHLPGAKGIGRGILEYHIADEVPDTNTEIVLYCRGGNRSALAAKSLQDMGYTNVYSMMGGFKEWVKNEFRPVTTHGEPIKH